LPNEESVTGKGSKRLLAREFSSKKFIKKIIKPKGVKEK